MSPRRSGLERGIFVESDAKAALADNEVRDNAVAAETFERRKVLRQSWRQWAGGVAYAALTMLVGELDEPPEATYPAGYDVYRSADYKGDFDGYSGEVVYVDDDARANARLPPVPPSAA